jgi:hypothetical protein
MTSPYDGVPKGQWEQKTKELIAKHPLKAREVVEVVKLSWDAIFQSKIGPHEFQIGKHIFPKPQIIGFLLETLIVLEFATRYPELWRGEQSAEDKDLNYIPDTQFSTEIKTSSHKSQIFGNRSYAQVPVDPKKSKSGYYIAVNFDKVVPDNPDPKVRGIRFGWLDHSDWTGQAAQTGQQASVKAESRVKLVVLDSDGTAFTNPSDDLFIALEGMSEAGD